MSSRPLRSRPFRSCDTVDKLFAQAVPGSVFDGTPTFSKKVKVLPLCLNNHPDHGLQGGNEDELDFLAVLEKIQGGCVVDVWAKS